MLDLFQDHLWSYLPLYLSLNNRKDSELTNVPMPLSFLTQTVLRELNMTMYYEFTL